MNNSIKLLLIFLASFAFIFTLNGLLSMNDTHGFFYVTPAKIVIRLLVALLITTQIATKISIPIPVVPTISFIVILTIAMAILLLSSCQGRDYKYKIVGKFQYKDSLYSAVYYTDTFTLKGDTAYYTNTDGSTVTILHPHKIDTLK